MSGVEIRTTESAEEDRSHRDALYRRIAILELTLSSQNRLVEDLREENKSLLASSTFGMQVNEVPEAE